MFASIHQPDKGDPSPGVLEDDSPTWTSRSSLRALIVEDDRFVNEQLAGILESFGFTTTCAAHVRDALAHVRHCADYTVAFVDLGLPDRSGLELIAELRVLKPQLPVIVATGYGAMVARDALVSDYRFPKLLTKPFDAERVHAALREVGIRP